MSREVRELRLWAPAASAVSVRIGGEDVACRRDGEWWRAAVEAEDGDRYRFVVDGDEVPDPRSRRQPDGALGPSAVLDLAPTEATSWTGRDLRRAVIHEVHVGTFSDEGTFTAAIEHLDHLVELGVTHVELMPFASFAGHHGWGYDGVHLSATHEPYGTAVDLGHLVEAAHARGLAVLADVVHNHLGPEGNLLARSGPYFTGRYRTPWGDAVNLDGPGSDEVRRFLIDSALFWIEDVGVDGLRMDAVHELVDTTARPYLEQVVAEVAAASERLGRRVVLVAESDRNDARLVHPPPAGTGLDGHWSDDLHHAVHVALTGEDQGYYADYAPEDLPRALVEGYVFQGDRFATARGLTPGRPVRGVSSEQLVVALQNHDQVGNRAAGERLHHLVGVDRTAAAAALTILSPFSLLLFQGEEWAASTPFPYFTDFDGPLADAVRRGRREEFAAFGWRDDQIADPQDPSSFRGAVLRWDERRDGDHARVLEWYRTLLGIRARHPDLEPAPLPRPFDAVDLADGVVTVRRGRLALVADLRPHGPTRASVLPGEVLASWGDAAHDGGAARTSPGSAVVVEAG
ncbi:malto-oligosyltrehalose trehalohydrolase [Dermatobacter hominis]|uniref:malto-oligosyltrehalose trehalohydrolase n=1 Tax=Dermatobacter hominis TaxID=2884263 RepID=UPI001D12F62C|nr:malto-oligosyltrehalose trehalohydrolase [Dermatobacter hominis]UDY37486.1 malto-oligosyltrehalose trehalohydrolase [Dermatobacter hominis]